MLEGETVIGGVHGPELHHHGCAHCLSWIFTRFDALGDVVNVRATLLDDAAGSNQSVLSTLYVGRRAVLDEEQAIHYADGEELWQTLTAGAVSTAAAE